MSTTWSSASPRLRLSGPAALVEAIPYLLGFRPRESVVALALRSVADGSPQVVATARADLDLTAIPALSGFAVRAAEQGADRAVVIAIGPPLQPGQAANLEWDEEDDDAVVRMAAAAGVGALLGQQGVVVVDLLQVAEVTGDRGERGWRWRSAWCEDPSAVRRTAGSCPTTGWCRRRPWVSA